MNLALSYFTFLEGCFHVGVSESFEWLFYSGDVWRKTTSMLMHLSRFVTQRHRIDLHDPAGSRRTLSSQTELVENILENYKGTSHNFCLTHSLTRAHSQTHKIRFQGGKISIQLDIIILPILAVLLLLLVMIRIILI